MFFYFSLFCVMVCVSLVCYVFVYLCSMYLAYDFIIIIIIIIIITIFPSVICSWFITYPSKSNGEINKCRIQSRLLK